MGREDRRRLSEPAERAQPVDRHRQAARRSGAPAPRHGCGRRPRPRPRDAHQGGHARPRGGHEALPAPALRRHAAALRHRHGAHDQPVVADHGRADDGPRCDHPGRRPRPRRRAQARVRLGDPLHHPRPRGDHQDLRPRGRDVRGRVHGAGRAERALQAPAASLHAGPSRLRAALRPYAAEALAGDHPGLDPPRRPAAAGLHLRAALQLRRGGLYRGATAAGGGRGRALVRLPAVGGRAAPRRLPARADGGRARDPDGVPHAGSPRPGGRRGGLLQGPQGRGPRRRRRRPRGVRRPDARRRR